MNKKEQIPTAISEAVESMLMPYVGAIDINSLWAQESNSLLKINEVAEELNVHPITVRRMVKKETLKSKWIGGSLRVLKSSVDELKSA